VLLTHDYSITTALISTGQVPATDLAVRRGIVVGDNVFIGMGAMVMPGAEIGDNVIIGAGTVVRGKVPSGSLWLGNPGSVSGSISELAERWKKRVETDAVTAD
jgi:acetyltransferase-like isoleucine patch superfamily enzyme